MGRTIRASCPESEAPALVKPPEGAWKIGVRLVTPLFGGGPRRAVRRWHTVCPQGDSRPASVLVALVAGWALPPDPDRSAVELMSLRETEIFGSAELPSPFDLIVSDVRLNGERRLDAKEEYEFGRLGPEAYALFSAKQNKVGAIVKEGATFTLEVRLSSARAFSRRQSIEQQRREESTKTASDGKRRPLDCLEQEAVRDHLRAAPVGMAQSRRPRRTYTAGCRFRHHGQAGILLPRGRQATTCPPGDDRLGRS